MQRYIKSVFWLVGFGGLGYVLLQLTQPDESRIAAIYRSQFNREQDRNTRLFLERLKESSQKK